jgi:hypothetical protein
MSSKVFCIRLDSWRSRRKFPMLVRREVDRKLEFTTNSNEAAGEIGTRNGGTILCIDKKKYSLHGDTHRTTFVGHNFQSFIQISIDTLDHHWVVVIPGENMAVQLKEFECVLEGTKEFAILVQDNCMAEPKFQLNFHDGRSKCLGGGMLNRFHGSKTSHSTTRYDISHIALKASMIACLISINKEDSK